MKHSKRSALQSSKPRNGLLSASLPFLLSFFWLIACTPTTGTYVPLGQAHIESVKKIALMVKDEGGFSVRLSREEMTSTGPAIGYFLFGVVGAIAGQAIEAGQKQAADTEIEEKFKSMTEKVGFQELLSERLRHYLKGSRSFEAVQISEAGTDQMSQNIQPDGTLIVTVMDWGLRRCLGPEEGKVQVGIDVKGKILTADETTVWERDELYLEGDCRSWKEFLSNEELFKERLIQATDNLAGRIVNEILYP